MTNFIGERYNHDEGKNINGSTQIKENKETNGIRIPVKDDGVCKLESGDFSYIKIEVTDIEYNKLSIY